MKLSPQELDAIIALLTRIYQDIREIEVQFQLMAGEGDFRPRIEHFHDAVRAFSSQDSKALEKGGRLGVEWLAYDLECLRKLQAMPLAPFKPHGADLSPSMDMVQVKEGLLLKRTRPDRATKDRLSELYQHYAVLFSALLKPMADKDYRERTDNLNHDVEELQSIVTHCEQLVKNKGNMEAIGNAILHLDDLELGQQLMEFMHQQKYKKKENVVKLQQFLKDYIQQKNKEIKAIDKAHMQYALAQFGLYEGAKDMLKTMAQRGMNLVGKFVQASISESQRDMGR